MLRAEYLFLSMILVGMTPSHAQMLVYSCNKKSYFPTELCLKDSSKFVYAEAWSGRPHPPSKYYERGYYETFGDTLLLQVTNVGLDDSMKSSFTKKAVKQGKYLLLLRDDNTAYLRMRRKRHGLNKCKLVM